MSLLTLCCHIRQDWFARENPSRLQRNPKSTFYRKKLSELSINRKLFINKKIPIWLSYKFWSDCVLKLFAILVLEITRLSNHGNLVCILSTIPNWNGYNWNGLQSHLSPWLFWFSRNLVPKKYLHQEVWSLRNMGRRNLVPAWKSLHSFFMLCQTYRGPDFSGTKFLRNQKSQGPKWNWGPFQLQPLKFLHTFDKMLHESYSHRTFKFERRNSRESSYTKFLIT